MRDKLIKLLEETGMIEGINRCNIVADELLENGVIVPPCKLNQTLWQNNWKEQVEQCRVSSLTQKADGSFKIRISQLYGGVYEIIPDKIGKTVFFTKEEAEQALKGGV
jgi:hypothetical protein